MIMVLRFFSEGEVLGSTLSLILGSSTLLNLPRVSLVDKFSTIVKKAYLQCYEIERSLGVEIIG